MKANEAPEKLYVDVRDNLSDSILYGFTEKRTDEDIEYARTDAFVEKAKKWFEKQNEWRDPNGNRHCDMESFEDFKNYIKGE